MKPSTTIAEGRRGRSQEGTTHEPVPASRARPDGHVLTCSGYDSVVRWREGERLEQLFERRCDELRGEGRERAAAVDGPSGTLSYAELDARANQLARFLAAQREVRAGDRVGLLLDRAVDAYVGMLAALKLRAVYVPLDSAFPAERVGFIAGDARTGVVLSHSHLRPQLEQLPPGTRVVFLDEVDVQIAGERDDRLEPDEVGEAADEICYVIYTSGTTGRPKGVAISHRSIVNFVRVASEVYGVRPEDRVYQGLTIAFDFSVEEIWVAWMAGATLVPKPGPEPLLGQDLHDFLAAHRVTALCCVPTLLQTLEQDLPHLRFLLVSGEACPQDLVERWWRPERRFLNVYGPTEATVSATWAVLDPTRPVTIGVPLPTYSAVVLDPEEERTLPPGELGELGLAGMGLAEGYLGRPELTARAFVRDFVSMPDNPSGRIYRTGDLVRVNELGELEHHGRIDTQVKIRGYRIEVAEIEAVLRSLPAVAQAVVDVREPVPGAKELVAYYTLRSELDCAQIDAYLREQLPAYMVPAYLEQLDELPLLPSGKVDRKALPAPGGPRRHTADGEYVAPDTALERILAEELAAVLELDRVSVTSHFFDELGSNSLLMARFTARVRRRSTDLPPVSIRDIYVHPTIRELAAKIEADGSEAAPEVPPFEDPLQGEPIGTPHYFLCGSLQALIFLAYAGLAAVAFEVASSWLVAGHGVFGVYMRAVAVGAAFVVGIGVLPILAKWLLIGRWRPQRIRVWSLAYVRFWVVKTLVVANPAARLLRGTLLYRYYLLALGARIEPGVLILTKHMPICTDLVSVGSGSVIRKDTFLNGYRARDGVIEIGPVTLGRDTFVGEFATLDIYSTVLDGATVGHVSSVHAGQVVPADETWHGSPVRPAPAGYEYRTVPSLPVSRRRRFGWNALVFLVAMLVGAPLEVALASIFFTHPGFVRGLSVPDVLGITAALMLGLIAIGLVLVAAVPRALSRWLEPGRVYPLYGFHYALQRVVLRLSNVPFLTRLFGDSVAIVGYLRYVGWRFRGVVQTGSNFGIDTRHEMPTLNSVGRGTMVSDGLSMMNAEFSASAFRVMPVEIGENCFLGNRLAWPAGARTGDNLLLGTMAMVPIGGEVRANTGLLGSPCFEIPRAVEGDEQYERLQREPERSRRLRAKTRHNVATMAFFLLNRYVFELIVLVIAFAPFSGWFGTLGSEVLDLCVVPIAVLGLAEIAAGARRLRPRFCPILDRQFWRHERFWKLQSNHWLHVFDGTPFKGPVLRAMGVRVGARLFDDGAGIVEQSLVTIGNDVTLNRASELQAHSLENGVFKSGHIKIGDRCTIGVHSLVNYEATMGPGSILEADSFLMKGSRVEAGARWRGNPAMEVSATEVSRSATEVSRSSGGVRELVARQPVPVTQEHRM